MHHVNNISRTWCKVGTSKAYVKSCEESRYEPQNGNDGHTSLTMGRRICNSIVYAITWHCLAQPHCLTCLSPLRIKELSSLQSAFSRMPIGSLFKTNSAHSSCYVQAVICYLAISNACLIVLVATLCTLAIANICYAIGLLTSVLLLDLRSTWHYFWLLTKLCEVHAIGWWCSYPIITYCTW